jgi:hypothetical protein
MTTQIGNTELNNKTINNILNTDNKNNSVKQTKSGKLRDLGLSTYTFDKESKDKNINVDGILPDRQEMIEVLQKKKEDKKKGIDIDNHDIIRPKPVEYNKNLSESIMSSDPFAINRNLRVKGKYYTVRDEINYYELNQVLKEMKSKFSYFKFDNKVYKINEIKYQNIDITTYISQTVKYLLLNFLIEFNKNVKQKNLGSKYHQFAPFQIININLMKIMFNKQINLYKFILTIELYRKNKRNSVNIYTEILYKADKDTIIYNKIYGIGFRQDDQLAFNKLTNMGNNNYFPAYKLDNEYKDELEIIKNDNEIDVILKKREEQYDLDYHLKQFKCYNPKSITGIDDDSLTQNDCISYSHKYGCPGKWDIPCKEDTECPFYKANQNYDNKRGGCIKGFCEMPVNVGGVGHHFIDKNKPLCYNCKKIGNNKDCKGLQCNQCCEEQKNRQLYPELATPDFAFKNDFTPRINQKEILDNRGLLPNQLI